MRRQAKASSAGSNTRQAAGLRRIVRGSLVARGGSGDGDGSGAPAGRRAALLALATAALFLVSVGQASAGLVTVNLVGSGTGTVLIPGKIECSNTPGKEKTTCSAFIGFGNGTLYALPDKPNILGPWTGTNLPATCDTTSFSVSGPFPGSFRTDCQTFWAGTVTLNARFQPPPSPPLASTGGATEVTGNQATLAGTANPDNTEYPVTECRFQFGESTAYGRAASCSTSEIPAGTSDVPVGYRVGLLKPETTYHYRLAIRNAGGVAYGADRTFTTGPAGADSCPNAATRSQQGAFFLPECRAFEMVSPPYKQSQQALWGFGTVHRHGGSPFSPDGDSLLWSSLGLFAGAEASINGSAYLSTRTPAGWTTTSVNPPFKYVGTTGALAVIASSTDRQGIALCGAVAASTALGGGDDSYPMACALRQPDGSWTTSPTFASSDNNSTTTGNGGGGVFPLIEIEGASSDLSHLVFQTSRTYLPSDADGGAQSLYEMTLDDGPDANIHLVNQDDGGTQIPSPRVRAVSGDGSTIVFDATPSGGVSTVYARVDASNTVALSNPSPAECTICDPTARAATFVGASADGSKVFFTTAQQLVDTDTDTTADLYEYDLDAGIGQHIVQVSRGGAGDLTPGSGAEVQGVVQASNDGSHAYFIAKGVLTTLPNALGQTATPGSSNLYVYERGPEDPSGSTRFVATLPAGDASALLGTFTPTVTTPDGRYLAFSVAAPLIASGPEADTDSAIDTYRYDALTGQLARVSVGEPGYPASGNGNTPGRNASLAARERSGNDATSSEGLQAMSSDGSYIAFTTTEALQAEDVNEANDVYLWHDGQVRMVSDGEANQKASGGTAAGAGEPRVSSSGSEVAFMTTTQILPEDSDDQPDIYVARVDGGFFRAPPTPECATNDACHGVPAPAPGTDSQASSIFSGSGNPQAPATKKKPKKKAKKQRRKAHHKRAHRKRAATHRHG